MASSKLYSLFNHWFDQTLGRAYGGGSNSNLGNSNKLYKQIKDLKDHFDNLTNGIITTKNRLNDITSEMTKLRNAGDTTSERYKRLRSIRNKLEEQQKEQSKKYDSEFKERLKQNHITREKFEELEQNLINSSNAADFHQLVYTRKIKESHGKILSELGVDIERFGFELLEVAGVISGAIKQVLDANEKLIKGLLRSGSALNAGNLGFDRYGNSLKGGKSIANVAASNFVQVDSILQSLAGLAQGNVAGLRDTLNADNLTEFAVQQAKLSSLYGIGEETLKSLTQTSTYFYGNSLKGLNDTLMSGAATAQNAGMSLKNYFDTMAALSAKVGDIYFAKGMDTIKDLSLLLNKFDLSADGFTKYFEGLDTFQGLMEKQAKLSSFGMYGFSAAQGKMFGEANTGEYDESSMRNIYGSLISDLSRIGGLGEGGTINAKGTKTLKRIDLSQDQIKSLQAVIHSLQYSGMSLEEFTGAVKASSEKIFDYNMAQDKATTLTEKFTALWGQVKTAFLDPLATILGPALSLTFNVLAIAVKTFSFVLSPLTGLFKVLGDGIEIVSNALFALTNWISDGVGSASTFWKITLDVLKAASLGFLIYFMRTKGVFTNLFNHIKEFSVTIWELISSLPKSFGGVGGSSGTPGKKGIGIVGGLVAAALVGGIGDDIGQNNTTKGSKANKIWNQNPLSSTLGFAAAGAEIGSFGGPVGTLVGGVGGAILGLLKVWFGYTQDKDQEEANKNLNIKPFKMEYNDFKQIKSIMTNRELHVNQEAENRTKAVQQMAKPVINVNIHPTQDSLISKGKVKARIN